MNVGSLGHAAAWGKEEEATLAFCGLVDDAARAKGAADVKRVRRFG